MDANLTEIPTGDLIKELGNRIGVYTASTVFLEFGNGIALRDAQGVFLTSGYDKAGRYIDAYRSGHDPILGK